MTRGPKHESAWGFFHWLRVSLLLAIVGCGGGLSAAALITPGDATPPWDGLSIQPIERNCVLAEPSLQRTGVAVMLLSPRMVYSMTEWPRMRLAALDAGLEVVAWKTPGLSSEEWTDAIRALEWDSGLSANLGDVPPACSYLFNGVNHFPFSLVAKERLVHTWPIWGVLSDKAWKGSLEFRLDALSQPSLARMGEAL